MLHLLEGSAQLERVCLESESQVTKEIKWQFPFRVEEESEAGGDLYVEAILAEANFIP